MTRAALGLGSNLGDRVATMQTAVSALDRQAGVVVVAVSPLYESDPVGGPQQDDFLNAVVLVDAELSARELLTVAHRLEDDAARVRDVRWGPRTLDVDLLAMHGVVIDDDTLTVPHPRAHERPFVLVPWADVEPDAMLGERTVAQWLATVGRGGVRLHAREWVAA